jgi:hypothetical protein
MEGGSMMRKLTLLLSIVSLSAGYTALADDTSYSPQGATSDNAQSTTSGGAQGQQPGVSGQATDNTGNANVGNAGNQQPGSAEPGYTTDNTGVSTATKEEVTKGGIADEVVGFKPQAGVINFRDPTATIQNRGVIGFTAEHNMAAAIADMTGNANLKTLYLGPETGLFYSHIGGPNANFVGAGTNEVAGANMLMIPLDLKLGASLGPTRLALHGGGNIFYRSITQAVALGKNADTSNLSSSWSILPNIGADFEIGKTNAVAFIARPDLTFGGSNRLWAGTVGVSIPLG